TDAAGAACGGTVTWSSSNGAAATVSATGLVTGVDAGGATITATAGSASGTASITVQAAVAAVDVTPAAQTVGVGATVQLTATPEDDAGNPLPGRTVTWSSSDDGVATVSATGLVTGVALGAATITATSEGVSGTAAITVIPASVGVDPATDLIRAGTTVQLTATPRDASGNPLTGLTISWSTSDDAVATVDANGLVTGEGLGTATITAEAGGQSGTAEIGVWANITGFWEGTIIAFGGTCGITLSLTEDPTGAFTGSGQLTGPQCITIDLAYVGQNATDGVPDSVTFTFTAPSNPALPAVDFTGNFDGIDMLTGVLNEPANFDNAPMTATRISLTPVAPPAISSAASEAPRAKSYARPERAEKR
ncbi:MAG: Ig-like domain-containing protein, partial [Gemmatimonadota bacterium]